MRNFSAPPSLRPERDGEPTLLNIETVADVSQTVTVRKQAYLGAQHLMQQDPGQWDWRALRDYVVAEIERQHGAWPRDEKKEYGIFSSFVKRWGEQAGEIAVAAFSVHGGMWSGKPITINRFCKGSDPYFAKPIAENLHQGVQGW